MAREREKTVVALADLHCGHIGAVTPPEYWWSPKARDPKVRQVAEAQREIWTAYTEEIKQIGPPDVLIVNGDLVEGPGRLTAGRELVTTDLETQCRIAAEVIAMWQPKAVVATYGTGYHVTLDGQDMEKFVIDILNREGIPSRIDSHAFLNVNGVVFDIRHFGGRAALPHTRATPLTREWLINQLWALRGEQPQGRIFLRAHTHSFAVVGGCRPDFLCFSQPALLAAMTIYGARRCSNVVDWGVLVFSIGPEGGVQWELVTRQLEASSRPALTVEELIASAHPGRKSEEGAFSAGPAGGDREER